MLDDVIYTNVLKIISLVAGVTGILLGLDLLLGNPVMNALKRLLDRTVNFDKIIARPKVRKGLGFVLVVLSLVIILLIRRI